MPGSKTEFDRYTRDELRELYQSDPALFDQLAAEAIKEACISEAPEATHKLQQMQRTIDAQLEQAKTQLERTQLMEKLFYGNVFDMAQIVETFSGLIRPAAAADEAPTRESVPGKR